MLSRLAIGLATAAMAATAFAPDPIGTWKGKPHLTLPKGEIPKEKRAEIEKAREQFKKASLLLVVKSDKTYRSTSFKTPADGKDHTAEGTWAFKGDKLTLTPLKRDGKPATGEGAKLHVLTLSADGKRLSRQITPLVMISYTKS